MTAWTYGVILAMAGVVAVILIVDLVRDRSAQDTHYVGLAVLELAVLAQPGRRLCRAGPHRAARRGRGLREPTWSPWR
ncbi:hypothetical protein G5V59_04665 [Nocardioides sp. W3-2-3]|uniref:hypothetical protein n=1 Tax=Nocardioides convexus TaxID=2712224 RepID=UPI00241862DE|nr:hypothetical protein [Nocardioides convexus]NGZ99839.1 hypothetical protein [Nocardioides convexus]